jgi:hypothetical protein
MHLAHSGELPAGREVGWRNSGSLPIFDSALPMALTRILAGGLFLMLPCAAQRSQAQKEWALGTAAVLAQIDGDRFDVLGGAEPISKVAPKDQVMLAQSWGIRSHDDLLTTIHSLVDGTTDYDRVAWNYPRAVNLLRWGYASGYIDEHEAWTLIMSAAQRMQRTFSSWHELGQAYVNARNVFFRDSVGQQRAGEYAYRILMMDGDSPWRKYPWNLDLGGGHPIPAASDKPAMFMVTPHPRGLICARLITPDTLAKPSFVPMTEAAIGCRPRITSERREKGNWIVDGECVRSEDVKGAQMVVPLRLQPVGDELRRQGISQLFLDISYYALGNSDLTPPVHDSWRYRGLQTYVDMRILDRVVPDLTLRFGISERDFHTFLSAAAGFVLLALIGALGLRWLLAQPSLLGPFLQNLLPTLFNLLFWAAWLVLSVGLHGLDIAGFWSGVEGWSAMITAFTWYGPAALALRLALEVVIARPGFPLSAPNVSLLQVLRACFWPVSRDMILAEVLLFVYNPQSPFHIVRVIFTIVAAAIASARQYAQLQQSLAPAKTA